MLLSCSLYFELVRDYPVRGAVTDGTSTRSHVRCSTSGSAYTFTQYREVVKSTFRNYHYYCTDAAGLVLDNIPCVVGAVDAVPLLKL
jgi:hypothetical protein